MSNAVKKVELTPALETVLKAREKRLSLPGDIDAMVREEMAIVITGASNCIGYNPNWGFALSPSRNWRRWHVHSQLPNDPLSGDNEESDILAIGYLGEKFTLERFKAETEEIIFSTRKRATIVSSLQVGCNELFSAMQETKFINASSLNMLAAVPISIDTKAQQSFAKKMQKGAAQWQKALGQGHVQWEDWNALTDCIDYLAILDEGSIQTRTIAPLILEARDIKTKVDQALLSQSIEHTLSTGEILLVHNAETHTSDATDDPGLPSADVLNRYFSKKEVA